MFPLITNTYTYGNTGQPHTLASVGVDNCSWDANGNMTGHGTKQLQWDEENRLWHADVPAKNRCAYYQYDADGERFYKNAGLMTEMTLNGQPSVYREYDEPVLYASPYLVATPEGYTKHYFVESERIASRIGDGSFTNINAHVVPDSLLAGKQSLADSVAPGNVVPNQFSYLRGLHSNWSEHHTTYWQHGDHLGSASWVTDTNGTACQHLQYMPWGEPLVDLRSSSSSYDTRYTFSGKERDEETGYSYFGARYYNSDLSIWLSVDPMSDKYPSTSPYVYCGNNPVKLVDPNGREIEIKEIVNNTIVDGDPPKQSFNKRVVNFLNNLDIKFQGHSDNSRYEGHSDGALSGKMYKKDYVVGGGILGLTTGLGALFEGGFTFFGLLTTASSVDDLFANSQGESGIQQCFSGRFAKTVIGIGKVGLSFSGGGIALQKGIKTKGAFQFFDSGINMFSTGINTFNTIDPFTNENVNKNESTDKKEQKGY